MAAIYCRVQYVFFFSLICLGVLQACSGVVKRNGNCHSYNCQQQNSPAEDFVIFESQKASIYFCVDT